MVYERYFPAAILPAALSRATRRLVGGGPAILRPNFPQLEITHVAARSLPVSVAWDI